MKGRIALAAVVLAAGVAGAHGETSFPLVPHRAAYEISLIEDYGQRSSSQTPVSASGLIAYEFSGSRCEGFASNFRQFTQLQRSEGDPVSSDIHALTFEDGDAKRMRFQIDSRMQGSDSPAVAGSASRGADSADTTVALSKPDAETMDIGKDILFPTEHVERIIAHAKAGGGTMEARVYDGSDTGKKVFQTLTVIGKEATTPTPEADFADTLGKVRRWPVTVSYFDEKARDAPPEYILSFDLYENGVSGTLKLDYGAFALQAKLKRLNVLPTPA